MAGSEGLPKPRPAPAVFFGGSRFPNKLEEAGAAPFVVAPNPPKGDTAGGLPTGVVLPDG